MTLILSGTSGLSDVDGSAATPAIRGTDANTGIFFPAADTIAFSEGGAEIARFDSSGNFGVGTSSMSGRLNVKAVDDTASGGVRLWGYNDGAGNGDRTVYISSISGSGNYNANINYSAWNHLFSIGGVEKARITSDGNLLVGSTSNPNVGKIGVTFTTGSSTAWVSKPSTDSSPTTMQFLNSSGAAVGSVTQTASATAYNTSSDYRLKENIASMTGALARIALLKPVTYKWKVDGSDGEGFIAHELAEVVPDCVYGEKDAVETYTDEDGNEQARPKYQGIDTSFLVATLTAAIQEQQAIITQLQADVAALKAQP